MIRRNTVRSRSKIIRMKKVPGPQLYSPREKLQDCIWIFTIGDADDKPSVPHAHAQERDIVWMHGLEIFIRRAVKENEQ